MNWEKTASLPPPVVRPLIACGFDFLDFSLIEMKIVSRVNFTPSAGDC
jgi:hypothetical protein